MNFLKKTGKVFALVLALSMLMTTAVFAEEPATEDDYVVTYSAEEVTDVDELIAMALEQKAEQPQTRARSAMPAEDNGQLNVTQVLEVREYADGTVEKDMVEAAIMPSKEQAMALRTDGYYYYDTSNSFLVKGYTVSGVFYFTRRQEGSRITYRANSVHTTINKTANVSTTVSGSGSSYHMYRVNRNNNGTFAEEYQNINYNNAKGGSQTFILASSYPGFYNSYNDYLAAMNDGVCGESSINFSNGYYIDLQYYAFRDGN